MKPTKNRVFCNSCHRVKMLFSSQEKADNFIKFNAENIAEENEEIPVRSYFCPVCGGWHVTHKEMTRAYVRTDKMNDKAFQLGVFVSRLKKDFDKKDWKRWKEDLEKYRPWITELQYMREHRLFLLEAKKQFDHYDKMVASEEKNEQKKKNKVLNDINAERKSLCNDIREKFKSLNWKDCVEPARRLKELMALPAFEMSEEKIKNECQDFVSCVLVGENPEILQRLIQNVNFLKGRMNYIPTTGLTDMVQSMTADWEVLTAGLTQKRFLHELDNRLKKCQKHLESRADHQTGSESVDKALQVLDNHCETIRQFLIDAVTALQESDNTKAIDYLTMADNRLKALPLSTRKIEMMKYMTAVAEKTAFE